MPGHNPDPDVAQFSTTPGNGVLSFIRSVARTVHNDFTREPGPTASTIDPENETGPMETGRDKVEGGREEVSILLFHLIWSCFVQGH